MAIVLVMGNLAWSAIHPAAEAKRTVPTNVIHRDTSDFKLDHGGAVSNLYPIMSRKC